MDNISNNPYQRNYKTKTEQYREKLKQRSNSQDWLFGNIFGKPGAGAPLRDNQGNIISHLKTINNDNIFKHDANYFSRGNNNITVLNKNIYNQNNLVLNSNLNKNGQMPIVIPRNQSISFPDRRNNNLIFQNNNNMNYNMNNSSLNQNQIPLRYIIPIQNLIPLNQINPIQINNNNPNYSNNISMTPSFRNNYKIVTPSINYITKSQNISNNSANNISIGKEDYKNDKLSEISKNNIKENEENSLFISNDNERNNRIQNEKKLEEWKKDLKEQMEQQKKKKEDEKKREAEEDKLEEQKYKEYLQYKSKQAEENKRNKTKWIKNRNQQSQNQSIEIEKTNNVELDKSQQSKMVNNVVNNKENEELEEEPYNQDNQLNAYEIPQEMIKEQDKLKNFIDDQYDSLGDIFAQKVKNEMERLSSKLTKKYEPFDNEENINNKSLYKYHNISAGRNRRKLDKIQDIIEERNLLEFIINRDNIPDSKSNFGSHNINKYYNLSSKMPSFFGKNVTPYETEFKQLNSEGRFIYGDFSRNKKRENKGNLILSDREKELKYTEQKHDNDFLINKVNKKFGKNINENMNSQSLEFSQSLDNKTSFIPIDKNQEKFNAEKINEFDSNINQKNIEEYYLYPKTEDIPKDKVEENIIKGLSEIKNLNKNVILYKKDGNIVKSFYDENSSNNETSSKLPIESKEDVLNTINNINENNFINDKEEDKHEKLIIDNKTNTDIESRDLFGNNSSN